MDLWYDFCNTMGFWYTMDLCYNICSKGSCLPTLLDPAASGTSAAASGTNETASGTRTPRSSNNVQSTQVGAKVKGFIEFQVRKINAFALQ